MWNVEEKTIAPEFLSALSDLFTITLHRCSHPFFSSIFYPHWYKSMWEPNVHKFMPTRPFGYTIWVEASRQPGIRAAVWKIKNILWWLTKVVCTNIFKMWVNQSPLLSVSGEHMGVFLIAVNKTGALAAQCYTGTMQHTPFVFQCWEKWKASQKFKALLNQIQFKALQLSRSQLTAHPCCSSVCLYCVSGDIQPNMQ